MTTYWEVLLGVCLGLICMAAFVGAIFIAVALFMYGFWYIGVPYSIFTFSFMIWLIIKDEPSGW